MKLIYFFLILLMVVYPNKLLEGTYINFLIVYIIYFFQLIFINKQKDKELIAHKNYSIWFFVSIFIVVLLGSLSSIIYTSYIGVEIEFFSYLKAIFRYSSYLFIFLILHNATRNKDDFNFIIKACLFVYAISLVMVALDSFRSEFIDSIFKPSSMLWLPDSHFRAYGAYLSPVSAGVFIMNSIIIILTCVLEDKSLSKRKTYILYIILLLSSYCLLASASRTGIGGIAVLLALILYKSKSRFSFLILIFIIGLIILQSGLLDTYIENMILKNENQSESTNILEGSGRYDTYEHSFDLYFGVRTLFFGVGPAEYTLGDGSFSYAHNGFLSIFLCYGLLGSIAFFAYFRQMLIREKEKKFNYILIKRFIIVNSITFISSDGPVTHFWFVFLVFFAYYITYNSVDYNNNYIKTQSGTV